MRRSVEAGQKLAKTVPKKKKEEYEIEKEFGIPSDTVEETDENPSTPTQKKGGKDLSTSRKGRSHPPLILVYLSLLTLSFSVDHPLILQHTIVYR